MRDLNLEGLDVSLSSCSGSCSEQCEAEVVDFGVFSSSSSTEDIVGVEVTLLQQQTMQSAECCVNMECSNSAFETEEEQTGAASSEVKSATLEEEEKEVAQNKRNELLYAIEDKPPWHLCALLGLQQFLTMVGSTLIVPFVITKALCIAATNPVKATFISTIIFTSGIVTLMQTTIGIRLPIIQGGTFSFLVPTTIFLQTAFPACDTLNLTAMTTAEQEHEYLIRIREVQGSIIVASLFQVFLGCTGLVGTCLSFIGPLGIVPTIALIGLALFEEAVTLAGTDWRISLLTICLVGTFSQLLPNLYLPVAAYSKLNKFHFKKLQIFKLFPVLLAILISWCVCGILTATGALATDSPSRTDKQLSIVAESPWIYVPYPFQWGLPTVSFSGVFGILAGVFVSMIESIGDYYAAARLSGAPPPPTHAVNRGITVEGIGCVVAGILGTGNGTTSYSENIGAIKITMVGSLRVIQAAGIIMIIFGIFVKFSSIFVTVPDPVVGGLFVVMFSLITSVGLSNLQMIDLNSSRNLFILGISLFMGLAIPSWMKKHEDAINTSYPALNQMITVLLKTSMFVGGFIGIVLDNTFPGTAEERGLDKWKHKLSTSEEEENNGDKNTIYDMPFGMDLIQRLEICKRVPISPTFVHFLTRSQRKKVSTLYNGAKIKLLKVFRVKKK